MKMKKIRVTRTGRRLILTLAITLGILFMSACNVTRTVSTKSEYYQRGDTSCMIVTKTIESYDATQKLH